MSFFLIIASWISSAVAYFWTYSLLEASLCPISPIDSITCFLISLDFGYISCFLLLYVHFSHHGLSDFLRHGLFLDIFTSWSFLMSNFSHISYFMSPDSLFLWTYNFLFAPLCPISLSTPISSPWLLIIFGYISHNYLVYIQLLVPIWKWYGKMKWYPSAITPFIIILQTLCNDPFIVYSIKYSIITLS